MKSVLLTKLYHVEDGLMWERGVLSIYDDATFRILNPEGALMADGNLEQVFNAALDMAEAVDNG